jgi:hypothetical protein
VITPTCSKCRATISAEDVNVGTDVAFCRACNVAHKLSALAHGSGIRPDLDLSRPPPGAWQRASGLGTLIGASHRSVGGAIAAFLFGAFWNGIVSIFVLLALASTLDHMGVTLPAWFPMPKFDRGELPIGMTIFLWLFLTPFIAIGLVMIGAFLMCLGGRTEVKVRDWQAELFTGIGPVGYRRKFKTDGVKDVRIEDRRWTDSDGDRSRKTHIVLEMAEGKPLKFGSSLSEERREFVAGALRSVILK